MSATATIERPVVQAGRATATVDRKALVAELRYAKKLIGERTAAIKLSIGGGKIVGRAGGRRGHVAWELVSSASRSSQATVSLAALLQAVSCLPPGEITISIDSGVRISSGPTRIALQPRLDVEDDVEPAHGLTWTLTAADVARLRLVALSASRGECRPILTGVLLGGGLAVATDSYRLTFGHLSGSPAQPALVPAHLFDFMPIGGVDLSFGGGDVSWSDGDRTVTARQIYGEYPDVNILGTETPATTIVVDRAALRTAVARACAMTKLSGDATPLLLQSVGGLLDLTLTVNRAEVFGDQVALCDPGPIPEPDMPGVAVNAHFLADCLRQVSGDRVKIGVVGPIKPIAITGSEAGMRCLLMPVRVTV